MGEKFRVSGKAISSQEKRSFIDRRGRNGVNATGSTQLHRRFDVTTSGLSSRTRFNPGLDKTTNIIQVKDYRLGKLVGNWLSLPNDVVAGLKIECTRSVGEQLCVADDNGNANSPDLFLGHGL